MSVILDMPGPLTPAKILYLYGTKYPAWEWELDPDTLERTGRKRKRQFVSYPRPSDAKPKPRIAMPFA